MENKELNNIAPILSKIKKEQAFKVPENYFEEFPQRVQEQIEASEAPVIRTGIFSIIKAQFKLALGFIALMITAYFVIQLVSESSLGEQTITEVSETDELYIYENINLDNDEILTVMYEDSSSTDDFTNDDIIEYLINDDIDYIAYLEEF